jgi:hypothetical protein
LSTPISQKQVSRRRSRPVCTFVRQTRRCTHDVAPSLVHLWPIDRLTDLESFQASTIPPSPSYTSLSSPKQSLPIMLLSSTSPSPPATSSASSTEACSISKQKPNIVAHVSSLLESVPTVSYMFPTGKPVYEPTTSDGASYSRSASPGSVAEKSSHPKYAAICRVSASDQWLWDLERSGRRQGKAGRSVVGQEPVRHRQAQGSERRDHTPAGVWRRDGRDLISSEGGETATDERTRRCCHGLTRSPIAPSRRNHLCVGPPSRVSVPDCLQLKGCPVQYVASSREEAAQQTETEDCCRVTADCSREAKARSRRKAARDEKGAASDKTSLIRRRNQTQRTLVNSQLLLLAKHLHAKLIIVSTGTDLLVESQSTGIARYRVSPQLTTQVLFSPFH